MPPCSSSGVAIIMTSAHRAPSATGTTSKPAASALAAEPDPARSAIFTASTPLSRRLAAWACPWLP